jgi:hypothetical protein
MSDYQLQAEQEMWEGAAQQDYWHQLERERQHWHRVERGEERPNALHYRAMRAKFKSPCDGCSSPVRRGEQILYASGAPRGYKVYHEDCFPQPKSTLTSS